MCYPVQENWFWKCFLSNEPLHKLLLSAKVNLNLFLELPCELYSVYSPSVHVVGLAEYVCPHPILYFYRWRSRLCSWRRWVGVPSCTQPCLWIRVTRRRYCMAQDSDDPLFIINIVVWVWVVILVIVALLCPLPRSVVRWWTIWCNKCAISLLGLLFVSHLSLHLWGDVSSTVLNMLLL